jgi:ribonuclease HI
MTSALAEYEGLLLGLDWLCEEMPSRLRQKDKGPSSNILLIQGDCKTVIDQLSGKSLSRKLQVQHRQALERLDRLQGIFDKMEFEHIPRSQNSVCDNLCANLMHAAASASWKNCLAELETVRGSTSTVQLSSRKNDNDDNRTPLSDILNRYLESGSSSWIKYSIRPPLYSRFVTLAEETGDYRTLIQVGELLASESQWHSLSTPLKARGIMYQIGGWRGVGQVKKAMALERKHRFLLESDVSMSTTTATPDEMLECVGTPIASWDQSISQNWSPLLDEWWKTANDKVCWEEEASLWVDSPQAAYTR